MATEEGRPEDAADPRGAWSPGGIAITAVLLSPLPAAVLHALNYARLGRPERKRRALVENACGAAAYVVAAYLVALWALLLSLAYAAYFQGSQSGLFEEHLARGGRRARLLLPALGWFLCTVGPLALLAEAVDRWMIVDRFDQGLSMIEDGRLDEAEAIFRDYLRSEPQNPWPRWNLAVIEDRRGRLREAAEHIRMLLREHPGFEGAEEYLRELEQRVRFARGLELIDEGGLDEAETIFRDFLETTPRDPWPRWNLAVIEHRRDRPREAAEHIRILLREHPGFDGAKEYLRELEQRVRILRGSELIGEGRLDEAEAIFVAYLKESPGARGARWNLAVIHERKGRVGRAIEEVEAILRDHPEDAEAADYLQRLKESPR